MPQLRRVSAGQARGEDRIRRQCPRVRKTGGQRGRHVSHFLEPAIALVGPDRDAHELVRPAQVPLGIVEVHEVDELAAAGLNHERQCGLLDHRGVDLPETQGLEEVGAKGREPYGLRVDSGATQQVQQ